VGVDTSRQAPEECAASFEVSLVHFVVSDSDYGGFYVEQLLGAAG
jgi:hypothetical protein